MTRPCMGARASSRGAAPGRTIEQRNEDQMADKSPRQHQSKKAGKTLKEKRGEKKAKQAGKRPLA